MGHRQDLDGNSIEDVLDLVIARSGSEDDLKIIIAFADQGSAASAQGGLFAMGASGVRVYHLAPAVSASMPASTVRFVTTMPGVVLVYHDALVRATLDSSGPVIRAPEARSTYGVNGAGVGIAIVDTGIDPSHKSLDDQDDNPQTTDPKIVGWYDVINGRNTPYDDHYHGTHVAATAAGTAAGTPYVGIAPGANLIGVKVLSGSGSGSESGVIDGMEWCVDNKDAYGIDVMSMSLGANVNGDGNSPLEQAATNAMNAGVVTVVAAGNSGPGSNTVGVPGSARDILTVGAVDDGKTVAYFSSRGPTRDGRLKPEVSAVGVDVIAASANTGTGYRSLSGTSMATPHVSGLVALVLERAAGSADPSEIRDILMSTAVDGGASGPDNSYGYGVVDSVEAVGAAIPPAHDLAVREMTLPSSVAPGEQVNASIVVRNNGLNAESDVSVRLVVDGVLVDDGILSTLASGASETVILSWQSPPTSGTHNMTGEVAPVPGESNLGNNALSRSLFVGIRLPTARAHTSAAWNGQYAYVFGGNDGNYLDQIVRVDVVTMKATTMAAKLPAGREGTSAVWTGTFAYIFGGESGPYSRSSGIVRYDPGTDTASLMPTPLPSGRTLTSAVWTGQYVYIFGGCTVTVCPTDEILRYDPATDAISVLAPRLPSARMGTSAVWAGGDAYVFGGETGQAHLRQVVRFSPSTGVVSIMAASLPIGGVETSATWSGSRAYVFGGLYGTTFGNQVVQYDPVTDLATVVSEDMTPARCCTSAALTTKGALVFGGLNGVYLSDIFQYPIGLQAPTNFTATPGPGLGEITLAWQPPVELGASPVTGYNVYRGSSPGSGMLHATLGNVLGFSDAGLPDTATYYYNVTAINSQLEGPSSPEVSANTYHPDAPDSPQNVEAEPGADLGKVVVTWTPPQAAGKPPTNGYRVYRGTTESNLVYVAQTGTVSKYDDSGLANDTSYFYGVSAINLVGEGDASAPVSVQTFAVVPPGSPQSLAATAGSGPGNITLSWVAPSPNAGPPPTGYRVYGGNASGTEAFLAQVGPNSIFVESGLGNGRTRFYKVGASNSVGEGPVSTETSATTFTVPSVPRNFTASTSTKAGEIVLRWEPSADSGGTQVTGYRLYRGDVPGQEIFLVQVGNALVYYDGGLGAGVTKYYRVSAVNVVGDGPMAPTASGSTLSTPGPPQNLIAVKGPAVGDMTLTWQPPAAGGDSGITNYRIYRGDSAESASFLAQVGNVGTYRDSTGPGGLTFYRLSAVNPAGEGELGSPTSVVADAVLKTARAHMSGVSTGQHVYIFGGQDGSYLNQILKYDPTTDKVTVMAATLLSGREGTSAVWTGTFAFVFGGESGPFARSDRIVRYDPWTDTTTFMSARLPTGRTLTSAVWTGQYVYIFGGCTTSVCPATDILRYDPAADAVTVMSPRLPSARMGTSAIWDGQSAYVFAGETGQAHLKQIVRYTPSTGSVSVMAATLPIGGVETSAVWNGASAYIFGGLFGTTFTSQVVQFSPAADSAIVRDEGIGPPRCCAGAVLVGETAITFGGLSTASTYLKHITEYEITLTPPRQLTAMPGSDLGSTVLSWQAPVDDGGTPITGYRVYRGSASGQETFIEELPVVFSYADGGLENGTTYYYVIRAVNALRESSPSNEVNTTTYAAVPPPAPHGLVASAGIGPGAITLRWNQSTPAGTQPPRSYRIYAGTASGSEDFLTEIEGAQNFTHTGLGNGVKRFYRVSAVNAIGEGGLSAEANGTTFIPPSKPVNLVAQFGPGPGEITLDWQTPSSNGGLPVTGYTVYRGNSSANKTLLAKVPTVTTFKDSGRSVRDTYFYSVTAANSAGEGLNSSDASARALGAGNVKTASNPDGSVTVFDDRDSDDTVDPGEEIARTPSVTPFESAYAESFDDGVADGWTKSGGTTNLWRVQADCSLTTGEFALTFNAPSPSCDYDVGHASGSVGSPMVDLTGAERAILTFRHFWQTERPTDAGRSDPLRAIDGWDRMSVEASSDGGATWTELKRWDSRDPKPGGWTSESIDIAGFISDQVSVRFTFDSVDSAWNTYLGWSVDDVAIIRG
ncbi:MAG: S8 family serine peptidase [Euryarchaeota archaeon]|nr:S8 family serine peptidase [Euryarchaeota archaeon]